MEINFPVRVNRYIAAQGIASRREADELIKAGKVLINGKRAELGSQVQKADVVEVQGKTPTKIYLAYYKGRGIITHSPGADEIDIAERLKKDYSITDVHPVGRLDKDSEGLIILSNDGRITAPLLDPESSHEKEYEVTVDKTVNQWFLKHLEEGVDIEGYTTKPAEAASHKSNPNRFTLIITEGKKHQIRRMCAALGYQIQSLKRIRVANIELGKLKPNQYRKIAGKELKELLKTLNIKQN